MKGHDAGPAPSLQPVRTKYSYKLRGSLIRSMVLFKEN